MPLFRQTKDGVNGYRPTASPRSGSPPPASALAPLAQENGVNVTGASDGGGVANANSGQEELEGNSRRDRDNVGKGGPVVEQPTAGRDAATAERLFCDDGISHCTLLQGEPEASKSLQEEGVVAVRAPEEAESDPGAACSVGFGTKEYNARRKKRAARGYATLRQLGRKLCEIDTV